MFHGTFFITSHMHVIKINKNKHFRTDENNDRTKIYVSLQVTMLFLPSFLDLVPYLIVL